MPITTTRPRQPSQQSITPELGRLRRIVGGHASRAWNRCAISPTRRAGAAPGGTSRQLPVPTRTSRPPAIQMSQDNPKKAPNAATDIHSKSDQTPGERADLCGFRALRSAPRDDGRRVTPGRSRGPSARGASQPTGVEQPCVGVDDGALVRSEEMLDEVATPPDPPKGDAPSQARKDVELLARASEQVCQRRYL